MGDSDPGSGRLTPAGSRHRRFSSFAAAGPGIRVIELHILGMQIQLLSINMGRRWPHRALVGVRRIRRTRGSTGPSLLNGAIVLQNVVGETISSSRDNFCCCCRRCWSV
jgi:hypothetical protein